MEENDFPLNALGQLGFSTVPPAVKVNLPDNTNESVPCKGLIQREMLIKSLAYEKMNDLKDAPDKSSQKWLCEVDHRDENPYYWRYVFWQLLHIWECSDGD